MFSDLAEIRDAVEARLKPLLPDDWKWVAYSGTLATVAAPTVYIQFTGISSTMNGEPLGPGYAAPELEVVITDPLTDTEKAEDAVDEHVLRVIFAVEHMDDLYWTSAIKRRLENGQMAWAIPLTAICYTPDPTTLEPIPEPTPDPMEEV